MRLYGLHSYTSVLSFQSNDFCYLLVTRFTHYMTAYPFQSIVYTHSTGTVHWLHGRYRQNFCLQKLRMPLAELVYFIKCFAVLHVHVVLGLPPQSYYSTGKSLVAITKYLLARATAICDKPFQTNSNSAFSMSLFCALYLRQNFN